jgi:acetyl-CoA synthetase
MLRTVYGDDERYLNEYWTAYSDEDADDWIYFPEDGAKIDDDGYITVLGRVDDVINVSGHRLGTMELESAIVGVEGVAEAAVVGGEHEMKGEAVYAYVIVEEGQEADDSLRERIVEAVEDDIGPFARPEAVVFTDALPKTRSGKIMRRLLEDIASGDELGDTSTLRNPDVVEDIERKLNR